MPHEDLVDLLQHEGRDPSRLLFEDELTGIHNRRFLLGYLHEQVRWESGEDFPLSLLMLDVDHLKQINDSHGRETGDQVLIWLADILWSEAGGRQAMPARYAGDEFVMLMTGAGPADGRLMADRIVQRMHDTPFELADGATLLPTVSIGIASAPEHAGSGRELIQQADTALYFSKRSGRNQATAIGEIDADRVSAKTALYRLQELPVAGRRSELAAVSEAAEAISDGSSQFVILEGAPGMGKTALLDAVQRNLSAAEIGRVVRTNGVLQEAFRPYYLASRFLGELFRQREDRGAAALQALSDDEKRLLGRAFPRFSGRGAVDDETDSDDPLEREALFRAFARLFSMGVESGALVLLVDDLHYADEATLLLLRALIQRGQRPLLICATAAETTLATSGDEQPPLQGFYEERAEELGIRKLRLRALTANDIATHLRGDFPGVALPEGIEDQLAHVTQGNPLFLVEIVRKLLQDEKLVVVGKGWSLQPLEEGYLPRSLEAIVGDKIAALDAERRGLLEQASTLGEESSLSLLAGSADVAESKVLEFLDHAQALGLVSLDFQLNDETLRFLGKRVVEISYGSIAPERREELHERVGSYQEGLLQHILGPSASILAYHFKRSANQEKAARYERARKTYSKSVFNAREAAGYGDPSDEDAEEEAAPLTPASLEQLPNVLRTFLTAVRNRRLYPADSEPIRTAQRALRQAVDRILAGDERLSLSQADQALLANRQRIDLPEARLMASSVVRLMSWADLRGITFLRGFEDTELDAVIGGLTGLDPDALAPAFWRRFCEEHRLGRIKLKQLGFASVDRRRRRGTAAATPPAAGAPRVDAIDWEELPALLRSLLAAAKSIRLYPADSRPVTSSISSLRAALEVILARRGELSFSTVEGALLINGARPVGAELHGLGDAMRELMRSLRIDSLTFASGVSARELKAFVGALRELPDPLDDDFWPAFVQRNDVRGLLFNEDRYATPAVSPAMAAQATAFEGAVAGGDHPEAPAAEQPVEPLPFDDLVDQLAELLCGQLVKGAPDRVREILLAVFDGFAAREPAARQRVVGACARALDGLMPAHRHQLTRLALDPLLAALASETDPRVLEPLASLLQGMAAASLPFAEHALASRIFSALSTRELELEELPHEGDASARLQAPLGVDAQNLLADDLRSGDAERQERAAAVLGSLGRPAIPLLIEIIKQEKQLRIGQVAASLLGRLGPDAEAELKRQLVLEVTVEQRFRLLELADQVSRDVLDELAICLGDENPKIRRAAFRLAERLKDERVVELLIRFTRDEDIAPAKGAIRSLATLGSEAAVQGIVRIMSSREAPDWLVACAQALGQTRHPAAIAPLARLLGWRKYPLVGPRRDPQVRATAAYSLSQIDDPRARRELARWTGDGDSRISRLARTAAAQGSSGG